MVSTMTNVERVEVPEGYKQTEVGVIPEEWDLSVLGQVCTLINGRGFKPFEWSDRGLPIIRIQNLNGSDEFNYYSGLYDPKIFIEHNQLLFAWSGSRGTSFGPHVWKGGNALLNYHTWKMVIDTKKIDSEFFYHALKVLTKIIEDSAHGASALVHTQKGDMEKFYFPMPRDRKEQTAIANALSDVDNLIAALETLIAKKSAIKTAAMQQLLTGKKRLPAFAGKSVGEHPKVSEQCDAKPNSACDTPSNYHADAENNHHQHTPRPGYKHTELGEIPEDWAVVDLGYLFENKLTRKRISEKDVVTFIGMQDVSESAKISNSHKVKYADVKSGFTYFERNDVLVAKITPCFENGKGAFTDVLETDIGFGSTEFHVLRATLDTDSKYLYYFTNTEKFRKELEGEMIGSAGHRRVPLSSIQSYQVAISKNKEEQTAIANVLSDMDTELDALQQRLSKTQKIKQGMMQELLTGKTRLINAS